MSGRCDECLFYQEVCPSDFDEPALGSCSWMDGKLPHSMRWANRERVMVEGNHTGCPQFLLNPYPDVPNDDRL